MRRRVIRSWAVSGPLAVLVALIIFASVRGFAGGALGRDDWSTVVASSVLGLGGLAGIVLAFRMGVAVSAAGITVRSLGRDRRIPRARIEEVTCERVGIGSGRPTYRLVVRLTTGERVPLRSMSTARWATAQRWTDTITAGLGRGPF